MLLREYKYKNKYYFYTEQFGSKFHILKYIYL